MAVSAQYGLPLHFEAGGKVWAFDQVARNHWSCLGPGPDQTFHWSDGVLQTIVNALANGETGTVSLTDLNELSEVTPRIDPDQS